ncbi:hypothetical protein THAOC_35287, partial [Thalassiosira oceanica]
LPSLPQLAQTSASVIAVAVGTGAQFMSGNELKRGVVRRPKPPYPVVPFLASGLHSARASTGFHVATLARPPPLG